MLVSRALRAAVIVFALVPGCSQCAPGSEADTSRIATAPVRPDARPPARRRSDFNAYILRAVESIDRDWRARGYAVGGYFTHDLDYSAAREIHASSKKPGTMCVAAVSEVIIDAIHEYARETGDTSVFGRLPAASWNGASRKDIRPYMFMFDSVKSNGPADALAKFGVGEHVDFSELEPGDVVGLNRDNGSGHAVIFN